VSLTKDQEAGNAESVDIMT